MTKPPFRPTLTGLEARDVPAALVQFIQNSPYAAAAKLDVYVNNTLTPILTGVPFRAATPFFVQDTTNPLFVSVRASGASVSTPPLFNQSFTLADNSKNLLVALGDPGAAAPAATRFRLLAVTTALTAAGTVGNVEFLDVNGVPTATAIDLKVRGVGVASNDLAFGAADAKYNSLAPANYALDVTQADGVTRVGSFAANLAGAANKALVVLGSGFAGFSPEGFNPATTFGLLAVNADGATALLPKASPPPLETGFAAAAAGNSPATFGPGGLPFDSALPASGRDQERVAYGVVNGNGRQVVVTGSGPGTPNRVTVARPSGIIDGVAIAAVAPLVISPFEASFTGGVFVSAADLDGDGIAEVIVTPDQGGGPIVAVYSGAKLAQGLTGDAAQLTRFFGIDDPAFRGGARASVGDVNGDGRPDLVVTAGFGGGPRVAVFDGKSVLTPPAAGQSPPKLVGDFFVFEQTLRNGVFVGVGDVNADGFADIVVGGGPGGGPRVQAISGKDLVAAGNKQTVVGNFFAGDVTNRDGVRLAVKDLDGDANADVVVGLGSAGSPQVRGFAGKDFAASVAGTAPTAIAALDLNPFTNPGVVYVG